MSRKKCEMPIPNSQEIIDFEIINTNENESEILTFGKALMLPQKIEE